MAWQCPSCKSKIEEEGFYTCWSCGYVNAAVQESVTSLKSPRGQSNSSTCSIQGAQGLSEESLQREINQDGIFVCYYKVTSFIVASYREPTSPVFIRNGAPHPPERLAATLHTLFFGWWGLPWGPTPLPLTKTLSISQ